MSYNLTLVASDKSPELTEKHFTEVARLCEQHGAKVESLETEWSDDGKAGRIKLADDASLQLMKKIRGILASDEIDCLVFDENLDIKLVVSDMESTATETECLDTLGERWGVGEIVKEKTASGMNGKMAFEDSLRFRLDLIKGMPTSHLDALKEEIEPEPGYVDFIQDCKAGGATCVLVTGGFTYFAEPMANQWGFDHYHANVLGIADCKLTGEPVGKIVDKQAKADYLLQYKDELGIEKDQIVALGDGDNDRGMFAEAGVDIGYHPKEIVLDNTKNCIVYGDFNTLRCGLSKTLDMEIAPGIPADDSPAEIKAEMALH